MHSVWCCAQGQRYKGTRVQWPSRNSPIGKLLKAFTGDGPFCSSGVVWGMTLSRKDFMAGWWSGCWEGGVCCFTSRLGSSWRDCCIICCCTLRGRPFKQQNNAGKLWGCVFIGTHSSILNSPPAQEESHQLQFYSYHDFWTKSRLKSTPGYILIKFFHWQVERVDLPAGLAAVG